MPFPFFDLPRELRDIMYGHVWVPNVLHPDMKRSLSEADSQYEASVAYVDNQLSFS